MNDSEFYRYGRSVADSRPVVTPPKYLSFKDEVVKVYWDEETLGKILALEEYGNTLLLVLDEVDEGELSDVNENTERSGYLKYIPLKRVRCIEIYRGG